MLSGGNLYRSISLQSFGYIYLSCFILIRCISMFYRTVGGHGGQCRHQSSDACCQSWRLGCRTGLSSGLDACGTSEHLTNTILKILYCKQLPSHKKIEDYVILLFISSLYYFLHINIVILTTFSVFPLNPW